MILAGGREREREVREEGETERERERESGEKRWEEKGNLRQCH